MKTFLSEAIGGILVAIGVVGELWFGFRAGLKDNQLRDINAEKIAKLNLLAEQEQLARVKLEQEIQERFSWRTISPSQHELLMNKAVDMGKQDLDVIVVGNAVEINQYAGRLVDPFSCAGWRITERCAKIFT